MRFVALGFALLGSVLCLVLGFMFTKESEKHTLRYDVEESLRSLASEWTVDDPFDPRRVYVRQSHLRRGTTVTDIEQLNERLREKNQGILRIKSSLPGLFASGLLGVLAGILVVFRQNKAAAVLMISVALGPVFFLNVVGVLATFPFFLAAILAILSPNRPVKDATTPIISTRFAVIGASAVAGVYWLVVLLGVVGVWPKGFKIIIS